MKIKKKRLIFICLILIIFSGTIMVIALNRQEKNKLDEVKLDIRDTNNSFAIYVEQSDGNYEESESKEFPKGYKYNYIKSNCTGIDGNIVSGVLDYNNETGIATVDTSDSLNCYLYFDKGAGLEIIGKVPKGLNLDTTSSSENWTGMYRFQGQQEDGVDNYICFGTSDQDECLKNQNKYMYRIIGIEESGRIKVIKKEALEDGEQWWSDDVTSKQWSESLIFEHINNTTFLKNTDLVPKGWEDKIDNNNWLFGSMLSNSTNGAKQNGVGVYKIESGQKEASWNEKAKDENEEYNGVKAQAYTPTSGSNSGITTYYIVHREKWSETTLPHEVDAKIGLMNISDYYLSVSNTANCQMEEGKYSGLCDTGWMHLSQNDNNPPSQDEWTMARYGWNLLWQNFYGHGVVKAGSPDLKTLSSLISVRPVFYLKSNNMLKEGSGTEEDPFVIEDVTYEGEPKGLIEFAPKGLNTTTTSNSDEWTGMYRFQGQQEDVVENYICFGTNDKDECLKNQDKYMYRIIGIEESGRIKVIKKEALEEADSWWSDGETSKHWSESIVFDHINHTTFLKNTELVPEGWEDKIDNNNWLFGTMNNRVEITGAGQTGIEVYKIESGQKEAEWDEKAEEGESYKGQQAISFKTTAGSRPGTEYYYIRHTEKWSETLLPHEINAKIGLINLSDYYLSVSNETNCHIHSKIYEKCPTGWIHLSQNNTNSKENIEITMTRVGWGINYGDLTCFAIFNTGDARAYGLSRKASVRPVFFLKNNIKIVDGNGKSDEPFIINL